LRIAGALGLKEYAASIVVAVEFDVLEAVVDEALERRWYPRDLLMVELRC
jgi:hypothetical protein